MLGFPNDSVEPALSCSLDKVWGCGGLAGHDRARTRCVAGKSLRSPSLYTISFSWMREAMQQNCCRDRHRRACSSLQGAPFLHLLRIAFNERRRFRRKWKISSPPRKSRLNRNARHSKSALTLEWIMNLLIPLSSQPKINSILWHRITASDLKFPIHRHRQKNFSRYR